MNSAPAEPKQSHTDGEEFSFHHKSRIYAHTVSAEACLLKHSNMESNAKRAAAYKSGVKGCVLAEEESLAVALVSGGN